MIDSWGHIWGHAKRYVMGYYKGGVETVDEPEMSTPLVELSDIWAAAGVILGFQATSFLWRISNEVAYSRETKNRDRTWLPLADMLNLIAMAVIVLGVFLGPLTKFWSLQGSSKSFGLALLLYVGHCFALAGHYELFNPWTTRCLGDSFITTRSRRFRNQRRISRTRRKSISGSAIEENGEAGQVAFLVRK